MSSDVLVEPFGVAVKPLDIESNRLVEQLHSAARQKAVDAFGPRKPEFEALELETTLWDLVSRLVGAPVVSKLSSQQLASLVSSWIQANRTEPQEPENLQTIKWMYTRNAVGKRTTNAEPVVSDLDLDAPLRQARSIAPEDRERDEVLYKYVFELLLAGEYARARQAAEDTNNWLLVASLNSMLGGEIEIGVYSTAVTANSLVPAACRAISNHTGVSSYERGIYGLLCGNLGAVQPLCKSWESLLLAYMLCGSGVAEFEQAAAKDHKIALQGADWRRRVVLALIQGRFPDLVAQLVQEVRETPASSVVVQNPWLARVCLHVQLALFPQNVDSTLVQVYIEYLCSDPQLLASRLDLVPAYVRFLPAATNQSAVYGHVLAQITDYEVQTQQIEQAKRYSIDLEGSIQRALQLNFDMFTSNSNSNSNSDDDEEANHRLVDILYLPVAAGEWSTVAKWTVRAYVLLFSLGRRSGVIELTNRLNAQYVRSEAMASIRQRLAEHADVVRDLAALGQYSLLGTALAALNEWSLSSKEVVDSRARAPKLLGTIIESVSAALKFGRPVDVNDEDMERIRREYVPQIVYELLDVLRDAQNISKGYAKVALDFAVKIADEDLKLYELFDATLLKALAEPALALS